MKQNLMKVTMALVTILSTAMAQAQSAPEVLACYRAGQAKAYIQITDPVLAQSDMAKVQFSNGSSDIMRLTQSSYILRNGRDQMIVKKYFHPYYQLEISGVKQMGNPKIEYHGTNKSEYQNEPVTCKTIGVSGRASIQGGVCCSWGLSSSSSCFGGC